MNGPGDGVVICMDLGIDSSYWAGRRAVEEIGVFVPYEIAYGRVLSGSFRSRSKEDRQSSRCSHEIACPVGRK